MGLLGCGTIEMLQGSMGAVRDLVGSVYGRSWVELGSV